MLVLRVFLCSFYIKKGNLIRIKTGLDTCLIRIHSRTPCHGTPLIQGRKNSININFLVRISCGHSWPLRPNAQGSKSFSPPPGPQEIALSGADVHDFQRGRPWPEGLSKNLVQKTFALIFWPPLWLFENFGQPQPSRVFWKKQAWRKRHTHQNRLFCELLSLVVRLSLT